MKESTNLKYLIIVLVLSTSFSCKNDDNSAVDIKPENSLISVANSKTDLSTLILALDRANLTTTLQGNTNYTILAPTDSAFNGFLAINGFGSINDVPIEILRQLLLNHILTGPVDLANLEAFETRYTQTLAESPNSEFNLAIFFDTTDGIVFNNSSKVTESDIFASNGIIHIIDNVIDIPTIRTFVSADGELSNLETALDIIANSSMVPSIIADTQSGSFTLFAPSDAAFEALLASNSNWGTLNDIDEALLKSIIEHHVLSQEVRTQGLAPTTTIETLEGDDITINFLNGVMEITDGSGSAGRIVKITDIQAVNGVIHILEDQVLMPDTTN